MFRQAILLSALALASNAQSSSSSAAVGSSTTSSITAQTTQQLFIGGDRDQDYVASVVAANACDTTYALVCTGGDYDGLYGETTCDPSLTVSSPKLLDNRFFTNLVQVSATYGPAYFEVSTATSISGSEATIVVSCSLDGTVSAVCANTLKANGGGDNINTQETTTLTDIAQFQFQVPVTAGASKLSGLPSCTQTPNAAPAVTGAVDIYKVLVAPGAAALLAGAGALL
jgi:hypothetical protein